jgi:hypothetical protein
VPIHGRLECPRCGSRERYRIVWGLIAGPLDDPNDTIAYGGCCIDPGMPRHQCAACGERYGFSYDPIEIDERLPDDAKDR